MRLLDIVKQLKLILPRYTSLLADTIDIDSILVSNGIATITTTSPHSLLTGYEIVGCNICTKTPIASVSKLGNIVTFTTLTAHDLTEGWQENVTLDGFDNDSWNTSFALWKVPNRYTFSIRSTLSMPSLSGSESLLEIRSDGINGRHQVTVLSAKTFTVSGISLDATYTGGEIKTGIRIVGAVTSDHALQMYTEQRLDRLWCFVVMDDMSVSKDRTSTSDGLAEKSKGTDMQMRILDGFKIILVLNVTDEVSAVNSVDLFRHDLLLPIMKSVYGAVFDTGLSSESSYRCIMKDAKFLSYNLASFAYVYDFEVIADITDDDTVNPEDTRAFRNLDFYQELSDNDDVEKMTDLEINLDDEP